MTDQPTGALWIYADRIVFQWDFDEDAPADRAVAGSELIADMDSEAPTALRLGGFTIFLIHESQEDFERRPTLRKR